MKKILKFASILTLVPFFANAYLDKVTNISDAALYIVSNTLVPLAFILSILLFFWGVAKYIKSEGDGKAEGKNIMIWGVVGIFVISSVWGLVVFIRGELDILGLTEGVIPTIR
ncbi:MAG: hypothetical protein AAB392_03250 [Patescibacteria group bacterium]